MSEILNLSINIVLNYKRALSKKLQLGMIFSKFLEIPSKVDQNMLETRRLKTKKTIKFVTFWFKNQENV